MGIENIHWSPGIGDPTIVGWLTVAVYFVVALICFKTAFMSRSERNLSTRYPEKSLRIFWLGLTFLLIFLGINKQLDLQTLFTQIGRDIAIEQGWYKDRRIVQAAFIIFMGLAGMISLTVLLKTFRHIHSSIKITLSGCVILFVFILMRAASFHHMSIFFDMESSCTRMNWLLELGGLIIIGTGGFQYSNSKNYNIA